MNTEYPEDKDLRRIAEWPYNDFVSLAEFVANLWAYPNYVDKYETIDEFDRKILRLSLSTGGWSGNEEIIGALRSNHLFYTMCFQRSERGGRHVYDISLKPQPESEIQSDE